MKTTWKTIAWFDDTNPSIYSVQVFAFLKGRRWWSRKGGAGSRSPILLWFQNGTFSQINTLTAITKTPNEMPLSLRWIMLKGKSHTHSATKAPATQAPGLHCCVEFGTVLIWVLLIQHGARSVQSLATSLLWETLNVALFSTSPHFWDDFYTKLFLH